MNTQGLGTDALTFPPYVEWQTARGGQVHYDSLTTSELLNARAESITKVIPYRYNAANRSLGGRLLALFPEDESIQSEDYCNTLVKNVYGPAIEIGGPTARYTQPLINTEKIQFTHYKPVRIINTITTGHETLRASACNLPFKNGSLGLVLASCLPAKARETLFDESYRVLEKGGVMGYQRGRDLDLYHALTLGFTLRAYSRKPRTDIGEEFTQTTQLWNFLLQK